MTIKKTQNPSSNAMIQRIESLSLSRIPLVRHLGMRIVAIDDRGLTVSAPLAPNRNHMGTGFAGSLASVATLAGWATALCLVDDPDAVHVVAQEITMKFRRPVTGDFIAWCARPDPAVAQKLRTTLAARGKARIAVEVHVRQEKRLAATLTGRFVLSRQSAT